MSSHRVRDVTFSSDDQACQTMELDLNPASLNNGSLNSGALKNASAKKSAPTNNDDATVVLDLTATQIHDLLDTESAAQNKARLSNAKK